MRRVDLIADFNYSKLVSIVTKLSKYAEVTTIACLYSFSNKTELYNFLLFLFPKYKNLRKMFKFKFHRVY